MVRAISTADCADHQDLFRFFRRIVWASRERQLLAAPDLQHRREEGTRAAGKPFCVDVGA